MHNRSWKLKCVIIFLIFWMCVFCIIVSLKTGLEPLQYIPLVGSRNSPHTIFSVNSINGRDAIYGLYSITSSKIHSSNNISKNNNKLHYDKESSKIVQDKTKTGSASFATENSSRWFKGAGSKARVEVTTAVNARDGTDNSIDDTSNVTAANESGICKFPKTDPFDRNILRVLDLTGEPMTCQENIPNMVYRRGQMLFVNMSKVRIVEERQKRTFGRCQYKSKGRDPLSDLRTVTLSSSPYFTTAMGLEPTDEHIQVECCDTSGRVMSRSYFAIVREKNKTEEILQEKYKEHVLQNSPKETLSVLMIGIDGTSKQQFERAMPKTRNFLLKNLQALELHKYNKIGSNTFPNILAMLTGKTLKEFFDLGWSYEKLFDKFNHYFLWSDYHKAGYRTGLMLDRKWITAFHYQKRGWQTEPVDYYMRQIAIDTDNDKEMKSPDEHCVGDIPEITLFHDYWVQLATAFNNSRTRPYFAFSFSERLTHDNQEVATRGDHLYQQFLRELHDKKLLNNTVLIFYSDHGPRFGRMRYMYQGTMEARTPLMFLVFPPWFYKKYPHIARTLKINQERLTTHFDIHATVLNLLNFQGETGLGNLSERGISLFKEIPIQRTCSDGHIPVAFCSCDHFVQSAVNPSFGQFLATTVVEKVQELAHRYLNLCMLLFLDKLHNVIEVKSNQMTEREIRDGVKKYQVWVVTRPGGALYEAIVVYNSRLTSAVVVGEVTRLNMYRGQAECIKDPSVRPYCFCKKKKYRNSEARFVYWE